MKNKISKITAIIPVLIIVSQLFIISAGPLSAQDTGKDKQPTTTEPAKTGEPAKVGKDGKPVAGETKKEAPKPLAEPKKPHRESVWDLIRKGGLTMVGLAIISTLILAFVLERAFYFKRQKIKTKGYYDRIHAALLSGGVKAVEKEVDGDPLLLSRIIQSGLVHKNEGVELVEKAIESSASVELGKLERGLNLMANLGNLAPLLGFFGTVVGMRASFLQFVDKAAPTAKDLAGGVEEALITTAAGLLIAIPTYLAHNLFIFYIDSTTIELERTASAIISKLRSKVPGGNTEA